MTSQFMKKIGKIKRKRSFSLNIVSILIELNDIPLIYVFIYLSVILYKINLTSMLNQTSPSQRFDFGIAVLIGQFWLSGLWILSLIFTFSDTQQLDRINMFMFITLGAGSLIGGYLSDIFDRILVFRIVSVLWLVGSVMVMINVSAGYIISAGCIGLLNNLTFVIIMEKWHSKKDAYTIYVLIGWASSQITLGVLFYFISNTSLFYLILFVLTLIYTISTLVCLEAGPVYQIQQGTQNEHTININNEQTGNQQSIRAWKVSLKKIIPSNVKSLIGGCILMFVMQMFYYRTQFTLDRFGISLQLNTIIVGAMEIVANVIFTKFINRFSRKLFLRAFLIVLAVLFIGLIIFSNKVFQSVIEGIMRLFDTCIMIVLGVYLPQLFDKEDRGKGTNYIMSFGVLGSALNSIILNNFKFWQLIFFLVIGFFSTFLFKQSSAQQSKPLIQQEDRSSN